MRNKKLLVLAALLCTALATAGIALAHALKSGDVTATSATFDATTVTDSVVKTCSINGGDTYSFSRAVYTGTSTSSDARLNGPLTIKGVSIVDTTTGAGALLASFKVDGAANAGTFGHIHASLSGGQLSGSLRAHVHGPWGELYAGVNGGFTAAGGFTSAAIGSGSSTDSGVVLSHGKCVKVLPFGW